MSELWESKEEELFATALSAPTLRERQAFLESIGQSDPELKRRIESLLHAHEDNRDLIQCTPMDQWNGGLESAAPHASTLASPPALEIDRYKLIRKIGEGGWCTVYLAEQKEPVRRLVAVKLIKPGMDSANVISRFELERQALAVMDHPNIARVLDAGTTPSGTPYFVMEFVLGKPITHFCDENKLGLRARIEMLVRVCFAIQHAHQKGIIHRDIKPSNIMVAMHDGVAVPKVIDFGIAKAVESSLMPSGQQTEMYQLVGTPSYMSPEQTDFGASDIDTRSDLYSLGALLYELLVDQPPFDAKTLGKGGLDQLRHIICKVDPPRPSARYKILPPDLQERIASRDHKDPARFSSELEGDLDSIAMKCLEKERERRYETANTLASDLQRYLNHEMVKARPATKWYEMQKFVRRHRVTVIGSAAVAVSLVVGTTVSIFQAIRADEERQNALAAKAESEKLQKQEAQLRSRAEMGERTARQYLYAANMSLIQKAWDENELGRLRQLLDETKDSPDRGFEWYYWQRKMHMDSGRLMGHSAGILSVAYSPSGRLIVTAGSDGIAKIWDTATRKLVSTLVGHSQQVISAAISPDEQRVVTGGADATLRVWDLQTGKTIAIRREHIDSVSSVVFSPDGEFIVSGGWDKVIRIWNASDVSLVRELKGHEALVTSAVVSPDGKLIASGAEDSTVRIWDFASGAPLSTLAGHTAGIIALAFSPDSKFVVSGSGDRTARVWQLSSPIPVHTFDKHHGGVRGVGYSPNGKWILTASGDRTAIIWDATTGKDLYTAIGHSDAIRSAAFSPTGKEFATAAEDRSVRLWSTEEISAPKPFAGLESSVQSIAVSPDGRWIVTGADDGNAIIWDATHCTESSRLRGHNSPIRAVAYSPNGKYIATGGVDLTAVIWDADAGTGVQVLIGHSGIVWSVAFSPDGKRLVTGSGDNSAIIWDVASGHKLATLTGHSGLVRSVAFSPDGRKIVTGSADKTAKVWDATTGKLLVTLRGHEDSVYSVAFSPDNTKVATGSVDRTARIWDASTAAQLQRFVGHVGAVSSVAFSPRGLRLLTGSLDKSARLWDVANATELLKLGGHNTGIQAAAFFPSGRKLVTGGSDGTVKVWESAGEAESGRWRKQDDEEIVILRQMDDERTTREIAARAARVNDPCVIKDWLIIGPIPIGVKDAAHLGIITEQIPDEAGLKPRVGDRLKLGPSEWIWSEQHLPDSKIDFNEILGGATERSVAYAICYLQSDTAHDGLVLKTGIDDQCRIYLNGKEIYRMAESRNYLTDLREVTEGVNLRAGKNVIVFKVLNITGQWQGSLRITDSAGKTVPGVRAVVNPD